ncbi:ABC transporter permease [Streptomyces sp. enrichment culture]|uniref:ABC transporter permease n=1 Tax=Streptomyces sp. enrichment culture TaxID=1795815 RepID=UPI003F543139
MNATLTTVPATTTPAGPAHAPRQTRWLLRLHRPALLAGAALVLLTGAGLLWLGGPLADASAAAWKQYNACAFDERCSYDQDAVIRFKDVYNYTTYAVLAVPFLVAAWAGGSLTGRETESGTARLAWTQGVSPSRWLASRLAFPAVLVLAATGLLTLLHRLAWTGTGDRIDTALVWDHYPTFYANGTVPVALALAGLAIGVLAGLVLRRAVAALAVATAALGALWAAVHSFLPHLWPAVTRVTGLREGPRGEGIWVGQGVLTADGDRLDAPCLTGMLPGCETSLSDLGAVSFYRDIHPAAHYWPLQLVASGIILAVAALLVLAAFRLLRHRTP